MATLPKYIQRRLRNYRYIMAGCIVVIAILVTVMVWPKKKHTKIIPLTAEQIIDKLREHQAKQRDTILIERINTIRERTKLIELQHEKNIDNINSMQPDQLQREFSNLER